VELLSLVSWLDETLKTATVPDSPRALNGLQLENSGAVTNVAAAVDASEPVIARAIESGADLLIVHHGMLWDGNRRIAGPWYRKLKLAMDANLAIYSAHLPLDVHPTLGNNAILAGLLGLKVDAAFAEVGVGGTVTTTTLRIFVDRVENAVQAPVHFAPGGSESIRRVAVLTGSGGDYVSAAAEQGYDTLVTGEGPHHTYITAEELGVNLIYAGHYATETFGVKALATAVEEKFQLPWSFIDHPTGL
jgi:dinuclear metal center YbgI/SA1388 family protein